MNSKFLDWYTQALGATLGMMACIFAYLNGFMFVYGNIGRNFNSLSFEEVLASYLLFPLCILTLILALVKSYIQSKDFFNISFDSLNFIAVLLTIAFGFMGAKVYFTIPALFILYSYIKKYLVHNNLKEQEKEEHYDEDIYSASEQNDNLMVTKVDMAKSLLEKNASNQFISEITGLSLEDINNLANNKNN
ncbi:MAG: hypothetical protein ACRDA3_06215 [Peptostreptococcaceae bacterium]